MRARHTIQITDREVRAWRDADARSDWERLTETAVDVQEAEVRVSAASDAAAKRSLEQSSWRHEPEQLAAIVVGTVRLLTTAPVRCRLTIPASWCYVQALEMPQRRPAQTALEFALEEFLPVPIESLTSTFIRCAAQSWLGIALETARIALLLEQLRQSRIEVDSIVVDALEAARGLAGGTGMIWIDAQHVAELNVGRESLERVRVLRLPGGVLAEAGLARITGDYGEPEATEEGKFVLAGPACAELLEASPGLAKPIEFGQPRRPRVELARGALSRSLNRNGHLTAWRNATAAVLASLVLLLVGLERRQIQLRQQIASVENWECGLYRTVFPGERIPAGVALQIQSERRRLEGVTMAGSEAFNRIPDALESLRQLVAALPANLRVNLQELRLEGNDLMLRGFTVDPGQAERLTQALGSIPGLQASPPRTDRAREGGVQFFAQATMAPTGKKEPS